MSVPILHGVTRWACPNCDRTEATAEQQPHTRFHACAGLKGLTAPYVEAGICCKVEAHEREDYIGTDLVTVDADGKPVSHVVATSDSGVEHVLAFAGCARVRVER